MNYEFIETVSEQEFIQKSVHSLKEKIQSFITQRGECIIGFSGGSTPKPIYEVLRKENIDWSKIKGFLIDERYVPPNDSRSNQYLVQQSLPALSLTAPDTTLPRPECIKKYSLDLKKLWHKHLPDIVILGMGIDGHIASLFPPLPQYLCDDSQLVAHTHTDSFDVSDRITLTLNPILAVTSHLVLLKGKDKKKTWDAMIKSHEDESRWPLKAVLEKPDTVVITQW